jgi:predicted CoA-substrate-specific enzyme activase
MNSYFLGIDIGSVTTKFALLDEQLELAGFRYLPTNGRPIKQAQTLLEEVRSLLTGDTNIAGAGTTGSGRYLVGELVGADIVKNEITAHAVAALHYFPETNTIFEIGGQDSKIIIVRDGVVVDFGMNTVCAAGTGSFLDHQALRLNITIEDFCREALESKHPVRIAGRCTVFAESDMIHKQQMGHSFADILYGLCKALVRNYINNVGLGKEIRPPIIFQGGVAYNLAIVKAFQEELGKEIFVPPHHEIMGAIGAAILAAENARRSKSASKFRGFEVIHNDFTTTSFFCGGCSNQCEIAQLQQKDKIIARWGGRCERWDNNSQPPAAA